MPWKLTSQDAELVVSFSQNKSSIKSSISGSI